MAYVPSGRRWGWFPWVLALSMGVVIVVNFGMIYAALSTFPGIAGSDGFDLSNHYDRVLDRVEKQSGLGWVLQIEADAAAHPVLRLTGPSGTVLAGAGINATAERPVGDPHTTRMIFTEVSPGHYASSAVLDEKGQWDIQITASAGGHDFVTTRRIVVR